MPITDAATATCAFTFTSGANDSFLKFCVTSNGNVVQMETPLGHEHIKHGVPGEGYGLCDTNTNTEYFDYSFFGDSPNWECLRWSVKPPRTCGSPAPPSTASGR